MFARYLGEEGTGLIKGEIYYVNVQEELVQDDRRFCVTVGDFWASDYSSFGEAMMEWEFALWSKS